MNKPKEYNRGVDLFRDTWKYGTRKQKEQVLCARGLHKSWAVTKSPDEMVKRGGGMAVRSLGKLFDEYVKRKPLKQRRIVWT